MAKYGDSKMIDWLVLGLKEEVEEVEEVGEASRGSKDILRAVKPFSVIL